MPIDPAAATTSIIAAWGPPGAIIVLLVLAVAWLAANLISSFNARIAENKAMMEAKFKDSIDMRDVMRDLKTAVDASTRTMETAVAVMKAKVS